MNIKEVFIEQYGQLKDAHYHFEAQTLNIIYGYNESGKSTLFHFIETMLFGFSRKKAEVERYAPTDLTHYGGYCIITLPSKQTIKITRYYKQHKGQPCIVLLEQNKDQYIAINEQYMSQDEFERMYISGLNRTIFRDLCALTLDELQATSMQDDAQLNQHLYHTTWESSKLISQLEKTSEDTLNSLYRPRGSKQRINTIVNELSRVKKQLHQLENELESYHALQARLERMEAEQEEIKEALTQKSKELSLLEKIEQDYPLYLKAKHIEFEQQQLQSQRLPSVDMLRDIKLYNQAREQKQDFIQNLLDKQQQLEVESEALKASINEQLLTMQRNIINQAQFIESLIDDVEVRKQQLDKQASYIKLKSAIGAVTFPEEFILQQAWEAEDISKVSKMEEKEQIIKQAIALYTHQQSELEKKLNYLQKQQQWIADCLAKRSNDDSQKQMNYTFVPQSLDELLRAEAGYDESYRRLLHSNSNGNHINHASRTKGRAKKTGLGKAVILMYSIALVVASILLITQFSWLNIALSAAVLFTAVLFNWNLNRHQSSKTYENSNWLEEEKAFRFQLSRLILSPHSSASHLFWTTEDDHQLKQELLLYKAKLKEIEQYKSELAAIEKESFELKYQLEQIEKIVREEQMKLDTLLDEWDRLLAIKLLPRHATFAEIKGFVHELENIKDSIVTRKLMQDRLEKDSLKIKLYEEELQQLASLMQIPFTDNVVQMTLFVKEHYYKHEELAKQLHYTGVQLNHLNTQLEQLMRPLIEEENKIRSTYELANNTTIAQWQAWIDLENKWTEYEAHLHNLIQERRTLLSLEQLHAINQKYELFSYDELAREAQLQHDEVEQLKQNQLSMLEERGQILERIALLSSMTERQYLEQQHLLLEEQLQEALKQYTTSAIVNYAVSITRNQFEAEHQPALMQQASYYIAQLTEGKYVKIVLQQETRSFLLSTSQMSMLPIERLSRGTAELVYFSLRLALLATHQSLRYAPLIFDDPFVNFDESRLQLILRFTHNLAQERQVMLMTCHPHILKQTEAHSRNVIRL